MGAKHIITFLTSGDPNGIKTIELSNWIGKAIVIPRALLAEAKNRSEIGQAAIYFLFGKDENENALAYIGEAENFLNRITNHDANKDFWDIVIAFVSKDKNLTKADVRFLEARAVELARVSKTYFLKNSTEPNTNNLPEYQVAAMEEFLENIDLLISAIGYPILHNVNNPKVQKEIPKNSSMYYCSGPWAQGEWIYASDGFIVKKWSLSRIKITKTAGATIAKNISELKNKGIIQKKNDESFEFLQDYSFSSPSTAAGVILARSANGWTNWKTKDGKTLHESERKQLQ